MSIALMTSAWSLDLSPTEKLALLALADWANDDGHCWPSMSKLAVKTGLTDRALRACVGRLVEMGHLTRNENPGKGVNYIVHPGTSFRPEARSPRNETTPTPERRSANTPIHTKVSLSDAGAMRGFADFWTAYPRKIGKAAAERAWPKACERQPAASIIAAARRYAEHPPDDPQFIPHPTTWLNQARFEDEPDDSNANHGNNRRMGGSDKPPAYRRDIGLELLRELAEHDDGYPGADAGPSGVHHGTVVALPLRSGH